MSVSVEVERWADKSVKRVNKKFVSGIQRHLQDPFVM